MEESSSSMKISPLGLMSAIIKGKLDPSNVSSEAAGDVASIILENRQFVMVLTTSVAVLIGCVIAFIWRRSSSQKPKPIEPPKRLIEKEPEVEVDDGKKKVSIFFGTQTGTAEGFAKAIAEEAKARYDKATFKVVDLVKIKKKKNLMIKFFFGYRFLNFDWLVLVTRI